MQSEKAAEAALSWEGGGEVEGGPENGEGGGVAPNTGLHAMAGEGAANALVRPLQLRETSRPCWLQAPIQGFTTGTCKGSCLFLQAIVALHAGRAIGAVTCCLKC